MKTAAVRMISLTMLAISLGSLLAQAPASAKPAPAKKAAASTQPTAATEPDPGERKFQANCSRCHTAPEQLSPRIVGTVVRHMRVRASLSAEDERDILRYLAP